MLRYPITFFFFFNDPAATEIYTLSLHDALPICGGAEGTEGWALIWGVWRSLVRHGRDRKSTRLNSSHSSISYAVFCLKKKNTHRRHRISQLNCLYYHALHHKLAALLLPTHQYPI